ncbi:MAG: hypothetical protein ABI240_09480 [Sphingomonas sp.]
MMMRKTTLMIARNLILIAVNVQQLARSRDFMFTRYLRRMHNRPACEARKQAQCGKEVEQAKHAIAF